MPPVPMHLECARHFCTRRPRCTLTPFWPLGAHDAITLFSGHQRKSLCRFRCPRLLSLSVPWKGSPPKQLCLPWGPLPLASGIKHKHQAHLVNQTWHGEWVATNLITISRAPLPECLTIVRAQSSARCTWSRSRLFNLIVLQFQNSEE